MNEIPKEITQQLAHIFARYGDEPNELMYKLECLVFEWFSKGIHEVTTTLQHRAKEPAV